MILKACITGCISAALIGFPANIIGCGPDVDPYDYYTSFFHQNLPQTDDYRPFYYTGFNFLYDTREPASLPDILAGEWAGYCGAAVTAADAKKLVNKFALKDLNNLYYHIEKNKPLSIPDSVKKNTMTGYFIQNKDLEALGYILYAKQVEPFVSISDNDWEPAVKDSAKMARLCKNGEQLYNASKKAFFKTKYAYQILRLAHYSGRYEDVISRYNEYAPQFKTANALEPLCLALKAGALFKTGHQKEAAYLFSRVFAATTAKRISNYLGFTWSVDRNTDRNDYLALCKNDAEKAYMQALFILGSTGNNLENLKDIYRLNPANELLEVLVVREINKLEEKYLTPYLQNITGGKAFYLTWTDAVTDSLITDAGNELKPLAAFLHDAGQSGKVKNPGLFETAAAYASYLIRDFGSTKKYLDAADKMVLTDNVKDQKELTGLLLTISTQQKIDGAFEQKLLPSLQWLETKIKAEKPVSIDYWEVQQWHNIYRNLMSEILAKRYHEQGDLAKETLCIGVADWVMKRTDGNYYSTAGIEFLRNNLVSDEVEKLYALVNQHAPSAYDTYLITHNAVTKKAVVDFAGTSYLRDFNYSKAIDWFKKAADKSVITKNPFAELLYDQEEQLHTEKKFSITKLAFAQEMLKLEIQSRQPATAAAAFYKMALGLYNITYYGHTWELVQYYRSGSDGYYIPKDATAFQKEYYGAFKAHDYFEKAMNASSDKNFKAKCLFMMAKCAQKQVHQPQYSEYETNWDQYDGAYKAYWPLFKKNRYFPQLVKEYSNTFFYKQAYGSCSYLRDFVKRKSTY